MRLELRDYHITCLARGNPVFARGHLSGAVRAQADLKQSDGANVCHVIPVEDGETGFVVPISAIPADEWHVSDAFGRFGGGSAAESFNRVAEIVTSAWDALYPKLTLPLTWKQPLRMELQCPIHLELIEGRSLQWPLVVTLLRTLCRDTEGGELPFGERPVFATGGVHADGEIDFVEGLRRKLEGFRREFPDAHTALLTHGQVGLLTDEAPELLEQMDVIEVSRLIDFMNLPQVHQRLLQFSAAPHPTELDALVLRMKHDYGMIKFDKAKQMARWALRVENIPASYHFIFATKKVITRLHKGQALEAKDDVLALKGKFEADGETLGVNERLEVCCALGVFAQDTCNLELGRENLRSHQCFSEYASADMRAAYWGTHCQLSRLTHDFEDGIKAGYESVKWALEGFISQAGRDNNYLIHALLCQARSNPGLFAASHKEAKERLKLSRGTYMPTNKAGAGSHTGFCMFYEGEIARQRKIAHKVRPHDWTGHWDHGYAFYILACARNTANSMDERRNYVCMLLEKDSAWQGSVLSFLFSFFKLYHTYLHESDLTDSASAIRGHLDKFKNAGLPGWKNRLENLVDECIGGDEAKIEALFNAVPYW